MDTLKEFLVKHKKAFTISFVTVVVIGMGGGTIAYTNSQNQKQDELSAKIKELEKQLENVDLNETVESEESVGIQSDELVTKSEQEQIENESQQEPITTENNSATIDDTELREQIKEEVTKQLEEQKKEETTSSEKEDIIYSSEDDSTPPAKEEDKVEGTTDSSMPEKEDGNSGVPDINVPDSYN